MKDGAPPIHPNLPPGWNNCAKCDWCYRMSVLEECPMCRHPWRQAVGFDQPSYEPPTFG